MKAKSIGDKPGFDSGLKLLLILWSIQISKLDLKKHYLLYVDGTRIKIRSALTNSHKISIQW